MKREDFKQVLPEHIKMCKKLIEFKGNCDVTKRALDKSCCECPFSLDNSTGRKICLDWLDNKTVVANSEEFIEMFKNELETAKKDGRVERIEDTQEFKDKHKHQPDTNNIKPNHYKLNIKGQDIEVMDIIDAVVKGMDGRKGYIVGNILKYVCRAEKKNGLEDYKKARTYLDMLIEG